MPWFTFGTGTAITDIAGFTSRSAERKLEHFAFSCRILGMGVERWLYQKLNQPKIHVSGEVIADIFDLALVDWVTQVSDDSNSNLVDIPKGRSTLG